MLLERPQCIAIHIKRKKISCGFNTLRTCQSYSNTKRMPTKIYVQNANKIYVSTGSNMLYLKPLCTHYAVAPARVVVHIIIMYHQVINEFLRLIELLCQNNNLKSHNSFQIDPM